MQLYTAPGLLILTVPVVILAVTIIIVHLRHLNQRLERIPLLPHLLQDIPIIKALDTAHALANPMSPTPHLPSSGRWILTIPSTGKDIIQIPRAAAINNPALHALLTGQTQLQKRR